MAIYKCKHTPAVWPGSSPVTIRTTPDGRPLAANSLSHLKADIASVVDAVLELVPATHLDGVLRLVRLPTVDSYSIIERVHVRLLLIIY